MPGTGQQTEEVERIARQALDVIRRVTLELHPHKKRDLAVELDSSLDRDLGFDSLARVELVSRIERDFHLRLPEALLAGASTPRDVVAAIMTGGVAEPLSAAAELRPLRLGSVDAAPEAAATLVEMLEWHVDRHPDRTHILLYGEADRAQEISYGELRGRSLAVAAGLRERGLATGESAAIMLPTSAEFFEAFFGVLYAGGVPVPIYPPFRPAQLEDHLRRQAAILINAEARVLVVPSEATAVAGLLRAQVAGLRGIETVDGLRGGSTSVEVPIGSGPSTALVQYTSGSTGDPKGVVLSNANLLANIRAIGRVMQASSSDVFVSWLPLYHDMGLIGAWLGCLYHAAPLVVMSPLRFLSRPESWLWAIHGHRATLSASPNFGYELCLGKVADRDIEGLDLSSWRMALNGAEPVSPSTMRRFAERFRPHGFRPEAMSPVYGLAESSVGLAFPPLGRGPLVDRVDRLALSGRGEAARASREDPTALEFVACGRPLPGHQVRVVDETGRELPDRHQGRLQFQGPSCTRGYFRNEQKTRELFDGPWLESGDLAYVVAGEIFITGRTKDIIIRGGRNVYPHELEEAIGDLPGARKGCVAVFPSTDPRTQVERLIVLVETRETDPVAIDALHARIEEQAAALLEAPPDDVLLVPPHSVLKTSSGKIRRAACREQYERGQVGPRRGPVWWQLARLTVSALSSRLREVGRSARRGLYAAWWWSVLSLGVATAWTLVLLVPGRRSRWRIVRLAARTVFWLSRTPLRIEGIENLPATGAILAVNHSSYFDVLVLSASISGELRFVAKRELAEQFFAGPLLRRLGALFVERSDLQASAEDARLLLEAAREGSRIVSFPEGTLTRMPGLLSFKLGSFVAAAQTMTPVVPIALRGTRSILRADQWFPRSGAVEMQIGKPLEARGTDWSAAVDLRDRARVEILWMCGEPDLEEETIHF